MFGRQQWELPPSYFHFMKRVTINLTAIMVLALAMECAQNGSNEKELLIEPAVITQSTKFDTDDPAIWINHSDLSKSLILGTDKNEDGALYVFDLQGKILEDLTVRGLRRPNNVDVEYGLEIGGKKIDIAVTGERMTHKLRIFSLPDMNPIDGGGISMFVGETGLEFRDLMGIALYKKPDDGSIYAFVGRKNGPTDGTYIWQYLLESSPEGEVKATLVRKLGAFSGQKEIEAIAVDDELGYVYFSDEGVGVRKYFADPAMGNEELALFGTTDFARDHEGISIYDSGNGKGFILVSDQQANRFNLYRREGSETSLHEHQLVKSIPLSTVESDGSEISNAHFNNTFEHGIFVAMSDDKTFQYYRVEDLIDKE